MTEERIGLYFGSFNPIHIGHLILANHIVQNTCLDKIWFVVSPQNPLKKQSLLADNNIRLRLVELAIQGNDKFSACDVEFSLPLPSYTVNTLKYLQDKHKDKVFSLIIGQDNLCVFDKWKDYNEILNTYNIYVYPRENSRQTLFDTHSNIHFVDAPMINISSTYIRNQIKENKNIQYLVEDRVFKEIERMNIYR